MANARCFLIGSEADTTQFEPIEVERLFPFNLSESSIFFTCQDAVSVARSKFKKDIPIFTVEVDAKLLQELKDENKVKIDLVNGIEIVKSQNLKHQDIKKITSIFVTCNHRNPREYFLDKTLVNLGLSKDTRPYEETWSMTPGSVVNKILAVLEKYKAGKFGLFRYNLENAQRIIEAVKRNETLFVIHSMVQQELLNNKDNYAILKGDFGAMLRVVLFKIKMEPNFNFVDDAKKTNEGIAPVSVDDYSQQKRP